MCQFSLGITGWKRDVPAQRPGEGQTRGKLRGKGDDGGTLVSAEKDEERQHFGRIAQ